MASYKLGQSPIRPETDAQRPDGRDSSPVGEKRTVNPSGLMTMALPTFIYSAVTEGHLFDLNLYIGFNSPLTGLNPQLWPWLLRFIHSPTFWEAVFILAFAIILVTLFPGGNIDIRAPPELDAKVRKVRETIASGNSAYLKGSYQDCQKVFYGVASQLVAELEGEEEVEKAHQRLGLIYVSITDQNSIPPEVFASLVAHLPSEKDGLLTRYRGIDLFPYKITATKKAIRLDRLAMLQDAGERGRVYQCNAQGSRQNGVEELKVPEEALVLLDPTQVWVSEIKGEIVSVVFTQTAAARFGSQGLPGDYAELLLGRSYWELSWFEVILAKVFGKVRVYRIKLRRLKTGRVSLVKWCQWITVTKTADGKSQGIPGVTIATLREATLSAFPEDISQHIHLAADSRLREYYLFKEWLNTADGITFKEEFREVTKRDFQLEDFAYLVVRSDLQKAASRQFPREHAEDFLRRRWQELSRPEARQGWLGYWRWMKEQGYPQERPDLYLDLFFNLHPEYTLLTDTLANLHLAQIRRSKLGNFQVGPVVLNARPGRWVRGVFIAPDRKGASANVPVFYGEWFNEANLSLLYRFLYAISEPWVIFGLPQISIECLPDWFLVRLYPQGIRYPRPHVQRVTRLAMAIAEEVGVDSQGKQAIRTAANLHDLGKAVKKIETLMHLKRRFNQEEEGLAAKHAALGVELIAPLCLFVVSEEVKQLIRQYHNKESGELNNNLLVQILFVADQLCARNERRPHHSEPRTYNPEITRRLIEGWRRHGLDESISAGILRLMEEGELARILGQVKTNKK